jgi:hypothetical protein
MHVCVCVWEAILFLLEGVSMKNFGRHEKVTFIMRENEPNEQPQKQNVMEL